MRSTVAFWTYPEMAKVAKEKKASKARTGLEPVTNWDCASKGEVATNYNYQLCYRASVREAGEVCGQPSKWAVAWPRAEVCELASNLLRGDKTEGAVERAETPGAKTLKRCERRGMLPRTMLSVIRVSGEAGMSIP